VIGLLTTQRAFYGNHVAGRPSDYLGAPLAAPADPANACATARPEWSLLALYELSNLFPGELKIVPIFVIPGFITMVIFLMPFIAKLLPVSLPVLGRSTIGQLANVVFVLLLIVAAVVLSLRVIQHDRSNDKHQAALEAGREQAERVVQLARSPTGIPVTGALTLLRNDPKIQGPRLYRQHCLSCHDHVDANGKGMTVERPLSYEDRNGKKVFMPNGGPNLFRFPDRAWLTGFLDPEQIAKVEFDEENNLVHSAPYYGNTTYRSGDMVAFVVDTFSDLDEEDQVARDEMVKWLSAEAELGFQAEADAELHANVLRGLPADATDDAKQAALLEAATETLEYFSCLDCHKFHDQGDLGTAPDLTGYGSRQWTIDLIRDPGHARFYEASGNDRMPAFNPPDEPARQQLTLQEIGLIVDWMREEWYRADEQPLAGKGQEPGGEPQKEQ
jgi:ubiquinol-cytochrome c reductase cytochrome b subunit